MTILSNDIKSALKSEQSVTYFGQMLPILNKVLVQLYSQCHLVFPGLLRAYWVPLVQLDKEYSYICSVVEAPLIFLLMSVFLLIFYHKCVIKCMNKHVTFN